METLEEALGKLSVREIERRYAAALRGHPVWRRWLRSLGLQNFSKIEQEKKDDGELFMSIDRRKSA